MLLNAPKRYHLKGIYFWSFKKLSIWYALTEMRDTNTEFDIWEIDLSELSDNDIKEDTTIGIPYSYFTYQNISPDKLKLVDIIKKGDSRLKLIYDELELENILMWIEDKLFDEI